MGAGPVNWSARIIIEAFLARREDRSRFTKIIDPGE
jgi:hypothetical protein